MSLHVVVLLVKLPEQSDYMIVTVTPAVMGFDWRDKAPVLRDARDFPSLQLNCSTTDYSHIEQSHYASLEFSSSSYPQEMRSKVEFSERYETHRQQMTTLGAENPYTALQSYLWAFPKDRQPVGFVQYRDGAYEPLDDPQDIVSRYRRMATQQLHDAQEQHEIKARNQWEIAHHEEIARLKELLDSYASGITKAE